MTKILIVDSSQTIRELFRIKFSYIFGSEIIGAANGQQGITALRDHPDIGLILLDTEMEDMSGLDFLKHVKQNELLSATPVVVLAMTGDEEHIFRLMSNGASAVFKKNSVRDMDLLQQVLKALATKKERTAHVPTAYSPSPRNLACDAVRP